ncbi:MAG: Bug family tripartite tricarboxylate transporter substrate binding protein [Hyphomicrobiaceae bacterium]
MRRAQISWPVAGAVLLLGAISAVAQPAEKFFAGRTITLIVGFGPGGTYDYYARLVARHLGRHIPGNPTVVVQSMPGAGSLTAANYLYNVAPKDGTAMGTLSQTLAIEQAVKNPGARYDVAKFNWIGRATSVTQVQLTMANSKIKTIEDAKTYETPVSHTGAGSPTLGYPKLLNGIVGTKFKFVGPYKGSTNGLLAMERGEVESASTSYTTVLQKRPQWIFKKEANFLVQYALKRIPELPNIPTFVELGKTAGDKQLMTLYVSGEEVGRSFLAPPGIPADRVAVLRKAFMAMIGDAETKAEAAKAKAELTPMSGRELQDFITQTMKVPPAVVQRMQGLLK